jgi:four helix bundle protein
MRDFRKLIVWQKAHELAVETHRALRARPARGSAASRNQLLRSITSVPANIAEGCGKRGDAEFARYLDIALRSLKESENHLILARDLGWIDMATHMSLDARLTEVRRMLYSLCRVMRVRLERTATDSAGEPGAGRMEH